MISVGNITAGGTGKTPFVEYLVRYAINRGRRVAVVSRGYKRSTRGTLVVSDGKEIRETPRSAGDEPFQIARKFPAIAVIVDEQRVRGARFARDHYAADTIILDDGFQHRSLARNLDIVTVDGFRSLSSEPMLPSGLRREPISAIKRADILAVREGSLEQEISSNISIPSVRVQYRTREVRSLSGDRIIPLKDLSGKKAVAFCGIGNPLSFRTTLENHGLTIAGFYPFPDHHRYTPSDLARVVRTYAKTASSFVITTEKDSVRLLSMGIPESFPVESSYYVVIEATVTEGEELLHRRLESTFELTV